MVFNFFIRIAENAYATIDVNSKKYPALKPIFESPK